LQKEWNFDFILTMGDNNYWTGSCESIQDNIGYYYGDYFPKGPTCINPHSSGSLNSSQIHKSENKEIRFFPSIGNHDWDTYQGFGVKNIPYFQYFNYLTSFNKQSMGQYYSIDPVKVIGRKPKMNGVLDLVAINSNLGMNGPTNESKIQMEWVRETLLSSTSHWKVPFFHHSPFTTAHHDPPATWMRWPFQNWGASAVLSGHEHTFERIFREKTLPYVVNGLSGHPWIYEINGDGCVPVNGSVVRYDNSHGIGFGVVSRNEFRMCFYSLENGITKVDDFALKK